MSTGFDQHKELYHGKYRHIQKSGDTNYAGEIVTPSAQARRKNLGACRRSKREGKRPLAPGVRGEGRNRSSLGHKTSKEGRNYLSIKLDDPSFNAPIFASLFADEDAKTFNLIWSRARASNGN